MKIPRVLFLTTLGMVFLSKSVSAEVTVVSPNEFDISLIYPLGLALTIALFCGEYFFQDNFRICRWHLKSMTTCMKYIA